MLTAILMLQAVFGPPAPRPVRVVVPLPCPPADANGDVVVCAKSTSEQRVDRITDKPDSAEPPLSFRLPGGGEGNVRAFQNDLPGASGKGAAVSVKMPFGRGRKEEKR